MTDISDADFKAHEDRITAMSMEALHELFHGIAFGREITMSNGQRAIVRPFFEPKVMERPEGEEDELHGCPCAGIDVSAADGSWHLEFILYQGGWGGAIGALEGVHTTEVRRA